MAKRKTAFFCQNCGAQSPKWLGKCPSCGEWNTIVEEILVANDDQGWIDEKNIKFSKSKPVSLDEIELDNEQRIKTNDQELDRVLGGGLVCGSLVLIGGEPGIGKSTLMLQIALQLTSVTILYVSGEESEQQLKMRAQRIGSQSSSLYILTETNLNAIFNQISSLKPSILIIDSIQTMFTDKVEAASGSVSQVRQCTGELMKFAKKTNTSIFLIGHITKEGSLAGPKILEHMVDTVIQFEGDRHLNYRILRTTKNRFGSTSELGIYEMQNNGLRQVSNPSEILISQREDGFSGISIGASLEGNRPLLIEIQSLVSSAAYGTPQRSSTGFDSKRLNMLLAVLEKRGGYRLGLQDVFLNIAGGLRIDDPAIDLAVAVSIISSLEEVPIPKKACFAAEIGLGGEIRAVNRIENRIMEAEKLGFEQIYISEYNIKGLNISRINMEIKPYSRLDSVLSSIIK
ncbi:MAG: DNA repair protein RadA [Cyclobacteriaceae bacterium]|nr:DNA repair protein RadA [Cyclobacteriaceae bacterium]